MKKARLPTIRKSPAADRKNLEIRYREIQELRRKIERETGRMPRKQALPFDDSAGSSSAEGC